MGIETRQRVPYPQQRVFAWFSRPGALKRLSPPWAPLRPLGEAASLRDGEAVLGLPLRIRWVARHDPALYREGERFADAPAWSGWSTLPTARMPWRHTHEVLADGDGTQVVDTVNTPVPRRYLAPMFAYRHRQLRDDLAAHAEAEAAGLRPLTIAMTGASGLVGRALSAFLTTGGHRVIRLVRREPSSPEERRWDPERPDPRLLLGCDAVIHLAGVSIAGRFTPEHLRAVEESRVGPTRELARVAALCGVLVFVSAAAIGVYGADRGDETLTEDAAAPPREDALAGIVRRWEAAAREGTAAGGGPAPRVVTVRTGLVQSADGGLLAPLRRLAATGLSGPIGGEQWQSWISLDDLVDVYHRALWDAALRGPVNAVAPHPVRNAEYMRTLARTLHRPAVLPVPRWAPALLLGREGAKELALASQRVEPAVLQGRGHRFRHPTLALALAHTLGKLPDDA